MAAESTAPGRPLVLLMNMMLLVLLPLLATADSAVPADSVRRAPAVPQVDAAVSSNFINTNQHDACLELTCGRGRRCQVTDSIATCVCVHHCPDRYKPVCGSDGMIYPNHCHLHRRACVDRRHIGPRRMQDCLTTHTDENAKATGARHSRPVTSRHSGRVTSQTQSWSPEQTIAQTQHKGSANVTSRTPAADPPASGDVIGDVTKTADGDVTTAASDVSDVPTRGDVIELTSDHICSLQQFQKMKDTLLAYSKGQLERSQASGRAISREYTISSMFSQYDSNNDGLLQLTELRQATERHHLSGLTPGCDLTDLAHFDDTSGDGALDINEFYTSFNKLYSIAMVSLDKALEVNMLSALLGDNVEIKCDVTGSPRPRVIWRRSGRDLSHLKESDDSLRVFADGSLYLSHVALIHAGNYTCHAEHNVDVQQTHVLSVHVPPTSEVSVRLQTRDVGQLASIECHVEGVPTPHITWLKNEAVLSRQPGHYDVTGGDSRLLIGPLSVSDTGAYMCEASSVSGRSRSVSSLLVQQQQEAQQQQQQQHQEHGGPAGRPTRQLMLFHDWGISLYDADTCRLEHQIQGSDIIPGSQDYVCGGIQRACSWGTAVSVGSSHVYVSQPRLQRVLLVSRQQLVVVDVIHTDQLPVRLEYVPHLDQVWVLNWRTENNRGVRTVEVIRQASRRRRHYTVHLEPINNHVDLVVDMLLPPTHLSGQEFGHAYVTHSNHRGMFKVDMRSLGFVKSVDLTPYNCVPQKAQFANFNGFVVLSCREPVTSRESGQLLYDQLTDTVVSAQPSVIGEPYLTPDSQTCVTVRRSGDVTVRTGDVTGDTGDVTGDTRANDVTTLAVQRLTARGLEFAFDVRTPLNISDVTFHPSRSGRGYDLYATAAGVPEVMFIDLRTGQVQILTSVGSGSKQRATPRWGRPERPLQSAGRFQRHLAAADGDTLLVLNGATQTVNCEVAGLQGLGIALWLDPLTDDTGSQ